LEELRVGPIQRAEILSARSDVGQEFNMSGIKIKTVAIAASLRVFLSSLVVLLMAVAATPCARAQTYEVLHRFHGKADGGIPFAGVIRDAAGNLYGTTQDGGDLTCNPSNVPPGCGVVFKLSTSGKETALHTFRGGANGADPSAVFLLRDAAGNLYGTAGGGSDLNCPPPNGPCGVVFKLDTAGKETVLYTFTGKGDGWFPNASLIRDAAGNLYGTAELGGDLNCFPAAVEPLPPQGCGTVFKLSTTTRKFTVLYTFKETDGAGPNPGVIRDASGNLYGATSGGGAYGYGVVFKLDESGKESVLYSFTGGTDGASPSANLIRDAAGNLYSTTYEGGDLSCFAPYGCGTVFKLDKSGKETVLHAFGGADGRYPSAGLIADAAGNLYGTTGGGGAHNFGVVFKLDKAGKETVLHAFTGKGDGWFPYAGLIRDEAGNLYGTAEQGGNLNCDSPSGCGVVFKLTP
jgi:uncharacterized repeat protein (TIGR03803 family)